MIERVSVFCGGAAGSEAGFTEEARRTGRMLAEQGIETVTGGGGNGLMRAVAEGALAAGGRVIGIIPERLILPEVAYPGLTRQEVVSSMFDRKTRMIELSDAFIILPGGLGTMDELFTVWSDAVVGYHNKPVGILNYRGYYDSLLQVIEQMVSKEFVYPQYRDMLIVTSDLMAMLSAFRNYRPPEDIATFLLRK